MLALLNARRPLIGLLCSSIGREDVWRAEERITRGRSAVRLHNGTTETCPRQKSQVPGSESLVPFSPFAHAVIGTLTAVRKELLVTMELFFSCLLIKGEISDVLESSSKPSPPPPCLQTWFTFKGERKKKSILFELYCATEHC